MASSARIFVLARGTPRSSLAASQPLIVGERLAIVAIIANRNSRDEGVQPAHRGRHSAAHTVPKAHRESSLIFASIFSRKT